MRVALVLVAAMLLAGCDNFHAVQRADTIEAYEGYLEKHPKSRMHFQAVTRLEELYLDRAKEEETLEGYDAYFARFPEGAYQERALKEREDLLYTWTIDQNTVEAWEKYLAQYPKAGKKRKKKAKRALKMAEYRPHLSLSEPRTQRVNLAENPEGPLDGWKYEVDVTNQGESTLTYLALTIRWQEPGHAADREEWPVVTARWPVPMEEEKKAPMKPGETRTWEWTTRKIPADYTGEITVQPTAVAYLGEE
ncbi:MAG: hypothetical protein JRI25_01800 [Deltaproteobacteria bacterium]|nr:hypothetical protein [Deltaproteobacteria bacterium]MBW2253314.1 hypothetical protein [Deltaproteobacteria bacterium]